LERTGLFNLSPFTPVRAASSRKVEDHGLVQERGVHGGEQFVNKLVNLPGRDNSHAGSAKVGRLIEQPTLLTELPT
jgi:hypothetical protein